MPLYSAYATHTTPWLPGLTADRAAPDSAVLFRDGEGRAFGLTMSDLAKGVYLTGAPRSGKTTVLYHLLSQLIPRLGPHDGLIIFDPRGDLRRQFFRPGDIVLDPNPHGHGNAAWSLFADLLAFGSTDYDLDQSAARIVTRLFADNQNQLTPFFTIAPRRLLENLLLVYARTILAHPETAGQYRNETLLKYCANLSREKIRELIRCAPAPGELRSYLGNCASDQALGVLGELQASVSALRGFAGGSSPVFSVVDFARDGGGKLLFLEFDASAADTQGPIFGLIEDLAYSTALSPLPQKGKIYFCSDEGPLLGSNVEMLQRALSFGAGQHIGGIFYAAQSNAQLHHCYGEALTESMLADFGTVIALRMKDVTTRRYVQQLCGTCTFPMQHARCGVVTTTLMQVPALPDDQMLSMATGNAIVLPPAGLPFSFHFLPWAG